MEKRWNLNRTMDDVVFEGRNKLYGAFELRSHYSNRMSRAMLMSILFFVTIFYVPKVIEVIFGKKQAIDIFEIVGPVLEIAPPPDIERPIQRPAAPSNPEPPRVDVIQNLPPTVVDDNSPEPDSPPPTQDDMAGKTIGSEDQQGTDNGDNGDIPPGDNPSNSGPVISEPVDDKPRIFAEKMPEFPGGTEALYKFINDNVKYSSIARDNRISGKIIVQFVVSKDGEIYGAKILIGLGGGLNAQVLDAVNKMPRWKPGMHNGMAVPVTFTLPVKFELMN